MELEEAAREYRKAVERLDRAVDNLSVAFQETGEAKALRKGFEDGLAEGKESHDLWIRVNGLDTTDIEKRVDTFMRTRLIGCTVTDQNQNVFRTALIEHFQYFQAALEAKES